jgi:hypothetical protein
MEDFPLAATVSGGPPEGAGAERDAQIEGPLRGRSNVLGLGVTAEAPLMPDRFSVLQIWPHLGLSFQLRRLGDHALHLRLATGPVLGPYQQGYYTPAAGPQQGDLLEHATMVLGGALFELGLQLRLRRFSSFRPSIDLGARIGGIGNSTTAAFVYGFPVRARLSMGSALHGFGLELAVVPEQLPATSFQYTGFGGGTTSRPRGFGVTASLGIVYEYQFRTR